MGIVGFVVIAGVAVLGLIPNRAVSDSASALARRDVAATLSNARTAQRFAPWSDAPDILIGQAQLIAKQRPAARTSFLRATQKEPGDWVAWQWLAHVTTGASHRHAVAMLLALDPRYNLGDRRP